jgi:hypothetical protein
MPVYEYKNAAGEKVERYFEMGASPEAITVDGVPYERIISGGARPLVRNTGAKVTGWSLPWKGDDDMTPAMEARVDSWTPEGVPVFDGHEKAAAFCAESKRAQERGEIERAFVYGGGPSPTEFAADQQAKHREARS